MASLLHDVEIDWGWHSLTDSQRAIARRYEAHVQADRASHTIDSIEQLLEAAGRELAGKLIRARAIDDVRRYTWQVVEGDVYTGEDFDETGMFPGELTAEDFHAAGVTVVRTPVVFPDSLLKSIEQRGWHHDGSLSTLVQGAWQLAADDVPAGFRTPGGPRRMQSIYLPVEVWAQLHDRAKAEARSVSYLVQRAVTAAYELPVE